MLKPRPEDAKIYCLKRNTTLPELEDWMKKKKCSEGNKRRKGKHLKCDRPKSSENSKKCGGKKRNRCYKSGRSMLRKLKMHWYSVKCLQRNPERKERKYALINTSVTVVVLEEMKAEKKPHENENGKENQAVNAKRGRAKVKESVRRTWEAVKAVLIVIARNQSVEGRLEV